MRRVAVLGGSFNPPHAGHIAAAKAVLNARLADEVWVMPCWRQAGKKLAPFRARMGMVREVCRGLRGIRASDFEARHNRTGKTIETVRALKRVYPNILFSWIIGSDLLRSLDSWDEASALKKAVDFIVVLREKGRMGKLPGNFRVLRAKTPNISSTEIRKALASGVSARKAACRASRVRAR